MSSLTRPLTGAMLTFGLSEELEELRGEEPYKRSGRSGKTLAKSGRLRLVMVAMAEGNVIGTHQAASPMTIHVLTGSIRYRANNDEHDLKAGQVLFFGPGEAHDIQALEESALLLTISAAGDDYKMPEPSEAEAPRGPATR